MKKFFLLIVMAAALVACDKSTWDLDLVGMVNGQSPTIDSRFAQSEAWNLAHGKNIVYARSEAYPIYICSDTHVSQTGYYWRQFLEAYRKDTACTMAIHLGDLIDAQGHWELLCDTRDSVLRETPAKHDTLFTLCGNHDLYWGQWTDYERCFHSSSYTVEVVTPSGARDFIIVFDSAEGTLGRRQLAWLRAELAAAKTKGYRHIIAATHTHFFKVDSSQGHTSLFPLEETYELADLLASAGVEFCLSGHRHSRGITHTRGMQYLVLDALKVTEPVKAYAVLTVGQTIDYRFVQIPD